MGAGPMEAFLILSLVLGAIHAEICTQSECVYKFDIRWSRTMSYTHEPTKRSYNVIEDNHKLLVSSNSVGLIEGNVLQPVIGRHVHHKEVITADGLMRNVITINGQFPGPAIEVMEGAKIIVHVTNNLHTDSLTIHWHGMHQRDSPWMDGVSYVTQCPIAPKETFTYKFTASPGGTHWYHSHLANQRQDGLYGPLIIHRKPPDLPYYVMMVSDWYKHDGNTILFMNAGTEEMDRHKAHNDHHNAHKVLESQIHSVLVNGRGRIQAEKGTLPLERFLVKPDSKYRFRVIHSGADFGYKISVDKHRLKILASDGYELEPFQVDAFFIYPGESVDFELEATQSSGSFWIRVVEEMLHETNIPGHEHLVSMKNETDREHVHHHHHGEDMVDDDDNDDDNDDEEDMDMGKHEGHDMGTGEMGHAGHDMDIVDKRQHYMTKRNAPSAATVENQHPAGHNPENTHEMHNMDSHSQHQDMDHNMHSMHNQEGRALLLYPQSLASMNPNSMDHNCTTDEPCEIFNCPSGLNIARSDIKCINFDTVRGSSETNQVVWDELDMHRTVTEKNFNFILSGNEKSMGSSVNGQKFVHPVSPFSDQLPLPQSIKPCNGCVGCKCTAMVDFPTDTVLDLVISNVQAQNQPIYAHHPIHLHGHSFAVLYIGYPTYEHGEGWIDADGIMCSDDNCDTAIKSHLHISKRHSIDARYNTKNPPIKDTLLIPSRGYAVVRIVTDNPGYWFIHCHVDQHLVDGMGILINSGADQHKVVPGDFPSCSQMSRSASSMFVSDGGKVPTENLIPAWAVIIIAVAMVVFGVIITIAGIYVIKKSRKGSAPL